MTCWSALAPSVGLAGAAPPLPASFERVEQLLEQLSCQPVSAACHLPAGCFQPL